MSWQQDRTWARAVTYQSHTALCSPLRLVTGVKTVHRGNKKWAFFSGSKQGNLLFVLSPLCFSKGPSKAFPELLV